MASGTRSAARSMREKPWRALAVVKRVFEGFVGQIIPLLEKTGPQHSLQPDRAAVAFSLGIERLDDGLQGLRVSMRAGNFSRRVTFSFTANSA